MILNYVFYFDIHSHVINTILITQKEYFEGLIIIANMKDLTRLHIYQHIFNFNVDRTQFRRFLFNIKIDLMRLLSYTMHIAWGCHFLGYAAESFICYADGVPQQVCFAALT